MILESLPQEIDKPLDGSDVVADDGGAAAFAEVQRLRAMMAAAAEENSALAEAAFAGEAADLSTFKSDLPPDLKAHLTDLFLSQDHNNDGVLSTDQFWLLLDEAGFDLNDEEKTNVIDKCDADHDGMITWQDFTDWVTMKGCGIETDEPPAKYWVPVKNLDGTVYFFNKYSGTTAWVIPGEEDEPEEDRVSGDLTSYFTELFLTSDRDGSGNLSADEFWNLLINDASLCLQPDEVQALRVRADFDADGVRAHVADRWGGSWADVGERALVHYVRCALQTQLTLPSLTTPSIPSLLFSVLYFSLFLLLLSQEVCWLEFLAVAKDLFRGAYNLRGSDWVAQVEIRENETGRVYYFNKATGQTSWHPFQEGEKEGSMLAQLRELKALRDNGDLTEDEFSEMKAKLIAVAERAAEGVAGDESADGAAASSIQKIARGRKMRKETSAIMTDFKQRRKTLVLDLEVESGKGKTRLQQRLEARKQKAEIAKAKKQATAKGEAMGASA